MHSQQALSALSQPGAVTTWGIDEQAMAEVEAMGGYSAFRVVQIDQNSGQTHVFTLCGIEIFGRKANPEMWVFWEIENLNFEIQIKGTVACVERFAID